MKRRKRKTVLRKSIPQGNHNTNIQINLAPASGMGPGNEADQALFRMQSAKKWGIQR